MLYVVSLKVAAGILTRMAVLVVGPSTSVYECDISRVAFDTVYRGGAEQLRVWKEEGADKYLLIPVKEITKVSRSQHFEIRNAEENIMGEKFNNTWSLRIDYGCDKSLTVITYWKECRHHLDGLFTYLEENLGAYLA